VGLADKGCISLWGRGSECYYEYVLFPGSFICGKRQNSFICCHMLKNRFVEFYLPAHDEFFDYIVQQ
jgi:hypothetical protein